MNDEYYDDEDDEDRNSATYQAKTANEMSQKETLHGGVTAAIAAARAASHAADGYP